MRRIEFIAPVNAMRGNLSGEQKLLYAQHNNPAFYAPAGKQFARNYGASYIGAKRASDNLKFFSVKSRSATVINADTLNQMAVFGAAGAIIGSMYSQKNKTPYINANAVYVLHRQADPTVGSFRQWLSALINQMLKYKEASIYQTATTPAGVTVVFSLDNPFVAHSQTTGAEVSNSILIKFWLQLANSPLIYSVAGATSKLIAHSGDTLENLISSDYNVLGLEEIDVDGVRAVGIHTNINNLYLNVKDNAGIVGHDFTLIADDQLPIQTGNTLYFGDYLAQD